MSNTKEREPRAVKPERKPTRAQRIRSYMQDSGMSRREAAALVDFEGDE